MPSTQASRCECLLEDDKFERCVRKCIIFPADGSEARTEHMIVETVTAAEDIKALRMFNRCVDLTSTYGSEHRNLQTRIMIYHSPNKSRYGWDVVPFYIIFCNRSVRLPVNCNITKLVGATPLLLRSKKRMFWRGDVVAMKVKAASDVKWDIQPLDAHMSNLGALEEFLRQQYQEGFWERELRYDEVQCK